MSDAPREKGIEADISKLSAREIEDPVPNMDDLTANVQGEEMVRIYVE